jgi:hypothetical protein
MSRYLFIIRLLEEFGCDLATLQQAFGNLRGLQSKRAKIVGLTLAPRFDLQAYEINCPDHRDTGHSQQQYLGAKAEVDPTINSGAAENRHVQQASNHHMLKYEALVTLLSITFR